MEELNISEIQERNDGTLESVSRLLEDSSSGIAKNKENLLCPSVLGSPKKKTSRDKLKSSIDCTQEQQSLKISEVDSISKNKFIPFGPSLF
jgi:hypothetical protein